MTKVDFKDAKRHETAIANAAIRDQEDIYWKPIPGCEPIELIDLGFSTCRWPVNVGGEIKYCGADSHEKTYCLAHRTIAYVPPKPRIIKR